MNRNLFWLSRFFQSLAVGIMAGCVALPIADVFRPFYYAGWNTTYIVVMCVLASLEASISYRLIQSESLEEEGVNWRFVIVELALLALLTRFTRYVGWSWDDIWWEMRLWPTHPRLIADPEWVIAFSLVMVAWYASLESAFDFHRAGEPPEPRRDYVSPMKSMTRRFYAGGIILLLAAGVAEAVSITMLDFSLGVVPRICLWAYFLMGLLVLAQIQYLTQSRRWAASKIEVGDQFARRWLRHSLVLIVVATLVAFLLPTGERLNRMGVVGILGGYLIQITNLIAAPPMRTVDVNQPNTPADAEVVLPPLEEAPSPSLETIIPGEPGAWWSAIFWVLLAALVIYIVYGYLRDRPEMFKSFRQMKLVRAVRLMWGSFREWLATWLSALKEYLPDERPSLRPGSLSLPGSPFRRVRLSGMSPRERVRYYYLSILRRAERQGVPRQHTQTPYEYAATLKPSVPDAQSEFDTLTQAFVEARYSRETVGPEKAGRVQEVWQRVKAALRGR